MKKALLLGFVLIACVASVAFASELHTGERYVLAKNETTKGNVYLAGGEVVLLGTVSKDATVAGGSVSAKGVINEDLLAAGGEVDVEGEVKGDVRVVGGTLVVSGAIAGDLAALGGDVHVRAGSIINGDVLVAGGRAFVDGLVTGSVRIAGGEASLAGEVKGGVWSMAETTVIEETAVIKGEFTNRGQREAVIMEGAVIEGEVIFDPFPMPKRSGFFGLGGLIGLFIATCGGLILLWLFKNRTNNMTAHGLAHFGKELLRGLIALFLVPIVIIVLCITVIGIPFGIVGLLLYIAAIIFAKILAGVMLGGWINRVFFKKPDQVFTWQTVVGGNVILYLLMQFVPFVGGIISAIFVLLAFGVLWGSMYKHLWVSR